MTNPLPDPAGPESAPTDRYATPVLPEHYRAEKVSGMMPDQIIFPNSGGLYSVDKATGAIYVDLDHKVVEYEVNPTFFGIDRSALMKVLLAEEGKEVEGYIADLRHINPGCIYEKLLTFTDGMTDSEKQFVEGQNRTNVPLLGAIFTDLDGKEYYQGDPRLVSHAARLAVELDHLQETTDSTLRSEIEQKMAALAVNTELSAAQMSKPA